MDNKSSTSSRSPGDVEDQPVAKKTRLVHTTIIYDESKANQWLDEPPLDETHVTSHVLSFFLFFCILINRVSRIKLQHSSTNVSNESLITCTHRNLGSRNHSTFYHSCMGTRIYYFLSSPCAVPARTHADLVYLEKPPSVA